MTRAPVRWRRLGLLALALCCACGSTGPGIAPGPAMAGPQAAASHGPGPAASQPRTAAEPSLASPLPAPLPALLPALLPSGARWRTHVIDELLPFWTRPEALGTPAGNFPTFRCNDGTAYRSEAPCPELASSPPWITRELGTEYTRMKSRQTFVYGVGYHVTGDPVLLAHARAGVDYLRRHAYERTTGSAISYWRAGQPGPPPGQRTTQDLAYAQLGLAFYYYLTRDPEVLADLVRLKDHIFARYHEPSWGMLRWVLEPGEAGGPEQQELVAQLDQINAYLLLVAPLLDEPLRSQWLGDVHRLASVLVDRFFAAEHGLFWGAIHAPGRMQLGSHHTDFGHSVKALWMILLTAELVGDARLVAFAREHLPRLVETAALPSGCWASGMSADGRVQRSSNWWTAAELDQATATLALRDRTFSRYLPASYACWLERFVDPRGHEVWPFVSPDWPKDLDSPVRPPKAFHWKNGYHSLEHALVALITTAGLTDQPIALHYAFRQVPARERIRPYLFQGTIEKTETLLLPGFPGHTGMRVVFRQIH